MNWNKKNDDYMTKKLKIKFAKFEKILVMQVLEQTGRFKSTEHVRTDIFPEFDSDKIYLRGEDSDYDLKIDYLSFFSNAERDKYLAKVVDWITKEQFLTTSSELKVGSNCEVRDHETATWKQRKLIAILPEQYVNRYVCECIEENKNIVYNWRYARPLAQYIKPKINGDVYTWEM